MNNMELAEKYKVLAMRFEDENYTDCGFEIATEQQEQLYQKLLTGNVSRKEYALIEPVFSYAGLNLGDFIKPKKFLGLF